MQHKVLQWHLFGNIIGSMTPVLKVLRHSCSTMFALKSFEVDVMTFKLRATSSLDSEGEGNSSVDVNISMASFLQGYVKFIHFKDTLILSKMV